MASSPPPNLPYLRTPDSRFENLPGFPYQPKYLQYGNLRMAYIDESSSGSGPETETFLMLHGEPTWSFLYRKMIPVFLNYTTKSDKQPRRRRIICPDLFGFGRSDKPIRDEDYTFHFHRSSLLHLIRTLNLTSITLVVQDWGGLLGLTLPIADPSRFKRLLVMNTFIATGGKPTPGFVSWRAFVNKSPDMAVGALLGRSCTHLSLAERAAYDAPYPGKDFKAGVRRFPNLVMVDDGSKEGIEISKESLEWYRRGGVFERPEDIFVVCGAKDPVMGPSTMQSVARIWGNGCVYAEVPDAGHFVQEWGAVIAEMAVEVFEGKKVKNTKRIVPEGKL